MRKNKREISAGNKKSPSGKAWGLRFLRRSDL